MLSEPVPTYTMLALEGATSIAPIEPTAKNPSETGSQLAPASVVLKTPPLAAPM